MPAESPSIKKLELDLDLSYPADENEIINAVTTISADTRLVRLSMEQDDAWPSDSFDKLEALICEVLKSLKLEVLKSLKPNDKAEICFDGLELHRFSKEALARIFACIQPTVHHISFRCSNLFHASPDQLHAIFGSMHSDIRAIQIEEKPRQLGRYIGQANDDNSTTLTFINLSSIAEKLPRKLKSFTLNFDLKYQNPRIFNDAWQRLPPELEELKLQSNKLPADKIDLVLKTLQHLPRTVRLLELSTFRTSKLDEWESVNNWISKDDLKSLDDWSPRNDRSPRDEARYLSLLKHIPPWVKYVLSDDFSDCWLDNKLILKFASYFECLDKLSTQFQNHEQSLNDFKRDLQVLIEPYEDRRSQSELLLLQESIYKRAQALKQTLQYEPGLWRNLHPIIKGILGVLAIITIVPALVVGFASEDGFIKGLAYTFFEQKKTKVASAAQSQGLYDELIDKALDNVKFAM